MDRSPSNHLTPARADMRPMMGTNAPVTLPVAAAPPADAGPIAATDRLDGFLAFLARRLGAPDYAHALGSLANAIAGHGADVARAGQPLAEHRRWYQPLAAALGEAHAGVQGRADG